MNKNNIKKLIKIEKNREKVPYQFNKYWPNLRH